MQWTKNSRAFEYSATDDDALTLARAVAREGRPYDAVAWTLVQRFAWLWPKYPTLAELVQAYAQPVNPRWFPGGDLHQRKVARLRRAGDDAGIADEERRAANRVEYASRAWDELPEAARLAALDAIEAEGESPVPGAVHFRASAAPKGASKKQGFDRAQRYAAGRADLADVVRIPAGYGPGVNWFFSTPGSTGNLQMIADGADILTPPPKGETAPEGMPPPPGAPTGDQWGWVWCYSPSFSSPPASEEPTEEGESSQASSDDLAELAAALEADAEEEDGPVLHS
ncbi:MAG: hypothetical protein OEZ01_00545 [Candidatus Heimdallarchaeota archaeon]|nr:hypothetical protein [Candidatus Heimdallarchaeota archaeon]MDH5676617.1 hypothetical protein [Myxococcales bacterium]